MLSSAYLFHPHYRPPFFIPLDQHPRHRPTQGTRRHHRPSKTWRSQRPIQRQTTTSQDQYTRLLHMYVFFPSIARLPTLTRGSRSLCRHNPPSPLYRTVFTRIPLQVYTSPPRKARLGLFLPPLSQLCRPRRRRRGRTRARSRRRRRGMGACRCCTAIRARHHPHDVCTPPRQSTSTRT